jgi:hypothetical protein
MAGYSGTPLSKKLGIRPDSTVYVDHGPISLDLAELDLGGHNNLVTRLPRTTGLSLLFCLDRSRLEKRMPIVVERTVPVGMIWVCWPKKASRVPTDLTENVVREVGLAAGMVDVKVAAIDDTWSGLKFVRRLADR